LIDVNASSARATTLQHMPRYRALFFNRTGKVFSETPFDADDDRAAVDYAKRTFTDARGLGYEVRQEKFLIRREFFQTAALV
jgi:hypothetical protein